MPSPSVRVHGRAIRSAVAVVVVVELATRQPRGALGEDAGFSGGRSRCVRGDY